MVAAPAAVILEQALLQQEQEEVTVVDKALVVDPEHQLDLDKMLAEHQVAIQTQALVVEALAK
jgi:hypothetical protein